MRNVLNNTEARRYTAKIMSQEERFFTMRLRWFHLVSIVIWALAIPFIGHSQATGTLEGIVLNDTQQPVSGAAVYLCVASRDALGQFTVPDGNACQPQNSFYSASTGTDGAFRFEYIQQSAFVIAVRPAGYTPKIQLVTNIANGRVTTLDPITVNKTIVTKLDVKDEVVQVSALELAGTPQVSQTLTFEQLRGIPTFQRNPIELVQTQAGVSDNLSAPATINALRPTFTNVTVDGINIQDNYLRTNGLRLSPNRLFLDQVDEFTLVTSNAAANQGFGAAQVAFHVPVGDPVLHGSAYWLSSHHPLNANDFLANANGVTAKTRYNQGGFRIGGPIGSSNRWFYYANYERMLDVTGQARKTYGLSPAAAAGNFVYYDSNNRPASVNVFNALSAAGIPIDPAGRQIFNSLASAGAQASPDLSANYGFITSPRLLRLSRNNFTGKLDIKPTPNEELSATYVFNHVDDNTDAYGTGIGTALPTVTGPRNLATVSWRRSFGAHFTQELRAGVNLARTDFARATPRGPYDVVFNNIDALNPTRLGAVDLFESSTASIEAIPVRGRDPLAGLGAFFGRSSLAPDQFRRSNTWNLQSNSTYHAGRHNLQFGYQSQLIRTTNTNNQNVTPTYTVGYDFGNCPVRSLCQDFLVTDIAGLLAGNVIAAAQVFNVASANGKPIPGAPATRRFNFDNHALYLQDSWQVTRDVLVTAGVRWELFPGMRERGHLLLVPQGGVPGGLLNANSAYSFSSGDGLYEFRKNNFAPNLGLAWRLASGTTFRAAYSRSFVNDNFINAAERQLSQNYGLQSSQLSTIYDPVVEPVNIGTLSKGVPTLAPPSQLTANLPAQINDPVQYLISTAGIDPHLKTPYVQQWSAGVQHRLFSNLLEVRYVGNRGTGLVKAANLNPSFYTAAFLRDFRATQAEVRGGAVSSSTLRDYFTFDSDAEDFYIGLLTNNQLGILLNDLYESRANFFGTSWVNAASKVLNAYGMNLANPNAFNGAFALGNYGYSNYHSLQVEWTGRPSRRIQYQINYTFGRAMTNSFATQTSQSDQFSAAPRDARNPRLDYVRSPFDLRHALKATWIARIPFGSGGLQMGKAGNTILGGWDLGGFFTVQSGAPFSVVSNLETIDAFGEGNTVNSLVSGSQLASAFQFSKAGFPSVFRGTDAALARLIAAPLAGSLGTLQPNYFTGPVVARVDLALQRDFRLNERHHLRFRTEALNAFNRANFAVRDQFVGIFSDVNGNALPYWSGGGTPTVFGPRRMQFSLRWMF
jgi:hypothetical protein